MLALAVARRGCRRYSSSSFRVGDPPSRRGYRAVRGCRFRGVRNPGGVLVDLSDEAAASCGLRVVLVSERERWRWRVLTFAVGRGRGIDEGGHGGETTLVVVVDGGGITVVRW